MREAKRSVAAAAGGCGGQGLGQGLEALVGPCRGEVKSGR